MLLIFKFVSVTVVLASTISAVSGSDFTKCKINDFDCQTKSAKEYTATFIQGIPSLGLSTLDPLKLGNVEGDTNGLKMKFTDVEVKGLKDSDFEKLQIDVDKSSLKFSAVVKVIATGDYTLNGRLLVLPVEGDGKFKIDVRKLRTDVTAELTKKTENGKDYLHVSKYSYKIDPLDIKFDFQNLFNGNEQLSEAVHTFANTNFKDVALEVGGPLLDAMHKKLIKHINKFLHKVPHEELFEQ